MLALKQPWEWVRQADLAALAAAASAAGLPAAAALLWPERPTSWDYDFSQPHWLFQPDGSPGPLNQIRRDLYAVLRTGDALGDHGWPESCLVSGPHVLPAGLILGSYPWADPDWPGVRTGAAGAFPTLRRVRVLADESFTLHARADVHDHDFGWTFDETEDIPPIIIGAHYAVTIDPPSDIIPAWGTASGTVWCEVLGGELPAGEITVRLNGAPATYVATATGDSTRYAVDVTGLARSGLTVDFTWSPTALPLPRPCTWRGADFAVRHNYGPGGSEPAVVAASGFSAVCEPDLRVTVAAGYLAGDHYVWPQFSHTPAEPYDESWTFTAYTLPVKTMLFDDKWVPGGNRLAPAWSLADAPWRPPCLAAPTQRQDSPVKDGLTDVTKPSFDFFYATPVECTRYAVTGFWIVRRGLVADHWPVLFERGEAGAPLVPQAATTRDAVQVQVGLWRGDPLAFVPVQTAVLGAHQSYVFVPLTRPLGVGTTERHPWAVLQNKACVWRAEPDQVEVTFQVVPAITLPPHGSAVAEDWDAGWSGERATGEYGSAWNGAPTVAWWNDTVALLGAWLEA